MKQKKMNLEQNLGQSNAALKEEQREISVADIVANWGVEPSAEFVESVRQYGVIKPVIVVPNHDGASIPYKVVDGRRRLWAAKVVGIEKVKAVIRLYESSASSLLVTLATNSHRSSNPIAEYRALMDLVRDGFMLEEIIQVSGISEEKVSKLMRLGLLGDEILQGVEDGTIALGTAMAMTRMRQTQIDALKVVFRENGKLLGRDVEAVQRAQIQDAITETASFLEEELDRDLEGIEGQDRESYTDTQDRESYVPDEIDEAYQTRTRGDGYSTIGVASIPTSLMKRAFEIMQAYRIDYDQWVENAWRREVEHIERMERKAAKASEPGSYKKARGVLNNDRKAEG